MQFIRFTLLSKVHISEHLIFNHVNAAPSEANWNGGDWRRLYHGEMVGAIVPKNDLAPGQSASWQAKSTGSTIQGSMNWYINGEEDQNCNMYFHTKLEHDDACGSTLNTPQMKGIKVTASIQNLTIVYVVSGELTP